MKNIKIQIIDESGSGKSIIETLIKDMLFEQGFNIIFDGQSDYQNFDQRLESVKKDSLIQIETVQTQRNIWENCKGLEGLTLKEEWIDRGILENEYNEISPL